MDVDFPFTIVDVVSCLGLTVRRITGNYMYLDCPECVVNPANGHNGMGKVEVRIAEGIYNCPRCASFGGGILDLYCYYKGCDKKTANREMREYVGQPQYKQKKMQIKKIVETAQQQTYNSTIAKRDVIDRTYRRFLSLCTLTDEHKKALMDRGLSEKNIIHFGFKSVPYEQERHREIIRTLLKEGYTLKEVPGFYLNRNGYWDYTLKEKSKGILIPMINLQNLLLGLQVRPDVQLKGKYFWFSSDKYGGWKRSSVPHITDTSSVCESVYLTEGGLKADVASVLSNRTFIAIAGTTQYVVLPGLFAQLKKNGVKRIIDAFDADYKYNSKVEEARQKVKQIALNAGLEYWRMEWDETFMVAGNKEVSTKGIDDYLYFVPKGHRKFTIYDK